MENTANKYLTWNSASIHKLFRKKKIKKIVPAAIMIICSMLVFVVLAGVIGSLWVDKNAKLGNYEGKTQEQIVADLNAIVAEGEMNVSIANTVKFPNGSLSEGDARIENIAANRVDQTVTIKLKGTNEILYESGAIQPGYYIQNISLNKYLDPGRYKAEAVFTGYKHEEQSSIFDIFSNKHEKTGSITTEINLLVE